MLRLATGSQIDLWREFSVDPTSSADQTSRIQAGINATVSRWGGGKCILPPTTIYAAGLSLPRGVVLAGVAIGNGTNNGSVLKLPNGANTFIVASASYINNTATVEGYGGLQDLCLDGNQANNASGLSCFILRGWRVEVDRVRISNSQQHGILISETTANGTDASNGMAENHISRSIFESNLGAGIYGKTGTAAALADTSILDSIFNTNGPNNFQIDLERSAGFIIRGNKMYGCAKGDIQALAAGGTLIQGNKLDGTNASATGVPIKQVYIAPGGYGTASVQGNDFKNALGSLGEATDFRCLEIAATTNNGVSVNGNFFYSATIAASSVVNSGVGAIAYGSNTYSDNMLSPA